MGGDGEGRHRGRCARRDRRPGFFDTFKEANALAKHLAAAHEQNESDLVRQLAGTHAKPFGLTSSPQEVKQGTVDT